MRRILNTIILTCLVTLLVPTIIFANTETEGQCEHILVGGACQECDYICEHVWDVENIEFSWGEESHASSVCMVCRFPVEKLCTVTEERIEPTCTQDGKVIITSVVNIDGVDYSGSYTVSLDAIDHVYEDDQCIYCGDVYITLTKPVLKTSASASGIKVSWAKVDKAENYLLYRKAARDWELVKKLNASQLSYTDKDLVASAEYFYRLKATAEADGKTFESDYSAQVKRTTTTIYAPKTVKAEKAGYKSIKVTWTRVYPATGYEIYRSTTGKDGSFKKVKTIQKATTLSWKNTGLTTGKKYYYKVRAVFGSDPSYAKKGNLSSSKSATPNISTPVMKKTTSVTGTTVKVSWNKVSYANGYTVYRKTTSGSWKSVGTVKGNATFSFKDSPKAGIYQYSVMAYRNVNGKKVYSSRSDSIQTRTLKAPTVTVKQVDEDLMQRITWTKVTGATEYQIWWKQGSGAWKVRTTHKASEDRGFIVSVPHGKDISWKVRAIYKKNGITTYGNYSKVKTLMISYEPYYRVTVPSASKAKMQYITLTVTNMGEFKMKILKEGAIVHPENLSGEKEMVLVNSSTNKKISSMTINPGATKKIKLKVVGGTTKYNQYYMVGFSFNYDGQDYVGVSSAYYGNYYQNIE